VQRVEQLGVDGVDAVGAPVAEQPVELRQRIALVAAVDVVGDAVALLAGVKDVD
jgi:hypothetical protein